MASGSLLTASGLGLIWLAIRNDHSLHAPRSSVVGIAMTFIVASAMAVLSAGGQDRYQDFLATLVLSGMGTACAGIALFGD